MSHKGKGHELMVPPKNLGEVSSYHHKRHWRRVRKKTHDSKGNVVYYYAEEAEEELTVRLNNKSSSKSKGVFHQRRYHYHSSSSSTPAIAPAPPKEITHFSHRHSLDKYKFLEEDEIVCNICETNILGSCFGCGDCVFFIHKKCKDIPKKIKHKSHSEDALTLRSSPSSSYKSGKFRCDGCRLTGDGFHYHCSPCKYDLHVTCAGSPSTVKYKQHTHPLKLYYDFPIKNEGIFKCRVCHTKINQNGWVYYNRDNRIMLHIDCAFDDEDEEDSILAIQDKLQTLKMK
ncbi:protein VACUOLELESS GAMETOPHYTES-like [Actinidia eriantha]|uniref:protein VACUOLELESS GAMETOPHYTES-like n=1 Tax=Actinidia eriantha TaxID=165200 RepID=UPI0025881DEC|nr:protein VACUOLELESS GAMETOPHYTES-like [Actinidia eriantha]